MRITFLTGEYPPMQGGIADHTARLARHMAPLGVDSTILISQRWEEKDRMQKNNETGQKPLPLPDPVVHPLLPGWNWRCWPAIVDYLTHRQPHILHIQYQAAAFDLGGWVNWLPWHLKKREVKTKIVTTFHDLRIPYIFPKAGSFRWKSMLALARHSDAVICTNREDQLRLDGEQLTLGSAPLLMHIPLGNNIEPQPPANFNRADWRARYQATYKTLLLAYFGFLNESKGGEELIEALALLRRQGADARLLLIGGEVGQTDPTNAGYAKKVQSLIDKYNVTDYVFRTGYVEQAEVSANLLAADAVVMPYRDGVSFRRTTLIAALRHGCPVVSTTPANPALIPEIEPGENMLLAPAKNAPALAETISQLVGNSSLREELSRGAKQLGGLFEWSKIASDTASLYQAVMRTYC